MTRQSPNLKKTGQSITPAQRWKTQEMGGVLCRWRVTVESVVICEKRRWSLLGGLEQAQTGMSG